MDKHAALKKSVEEFNNGEYFECHETLEDVWMIEVEPDRLFYQGLLQLSVGFFHLFNRNYVGAASQWRKGYVKLQNFGECHLGINLKTLLEQIHRCQNMLEMVQSDSRQTFDFSIVPRIQMREIVKSSKGSAPPDG
jgi:predicted metal-dependent hydrolase